MSEQINQFGSPIGKAPGNGTKFAGQIQELFRRIEVLTNNHNGLCRVVGECQEKENQIIEQQAKLAEAIKNLAAAMDHLSKQIKAIQDRAPLSMENISIDDVFTTTGPGSTTRIECEQLWGPPKKYIGEPIVFELPRGTAFNHIKDSDEGWVDLEMPLPEPLPVGTYFKLPCHDMTIKGPIAVALDPNATISIKVTGEDPGSPDNQG